MNLRKLALASLFTAVAGIPAVTMADSDLGVGPAATATADLNFSIVIPQFVYFQVGASAVPGNLDTVAFNLGAVEPGEVRLGDLRDYVEQNFRHVAQQKGLDFAVELQPGVPISVVTDAKRLQQILETHFSDNVQARELNRDGNYTPVKARKGKALRSQEFFAKQAARMHRPRAQSPDVLVPHVPK